MKLLVITALFGLAAAANPAYYQQQQQQSSRPNADFERNARIIALDSDVKEDSFRYNYETENGIKAEEQGREADGMEVQGGFEYTGDDGHQYVVSYSAGQGGFLPQGAHIPTPPPIPAEILKALEQNAADEAAGIVDDGQYNPAKYGTGAAPGAGAAPAYSQQQYRAQAGYRQQYKY